jgi:2-(1,2-epoxy-1,2-dihydrophenyl)acetyl-CoA isomerase
MQYNCILLEKKEGIATITLNRPERLNAFIPEMTEELLDAFENVDDDNDVRVLVITGAGRAFCAGADMEGGLLRMRAAVEKKQMGRTDPVRKTREQIPMNMRNMTKPIIASINGHAVGVGLSFALLCDIRIASDDARLHIGFGRVGMSSEFCMTYYLPRIVGMGKACELLFTGAVLSAAEAKEIGLVNRVVSASELKQATDELARTIADSPPATLYFLKRQLYQGLESNIAAHIQHEVYGLTVCRMTEDHLEGVKAFMEKRAPKFTGR